MRAAMAQPCVNPAGGRLGSLLMLRNPREICCGGPTAPLHAPPPATRGCALGRRHNRAGGCSELPWVSVLGAEPQLGPSSSFAGVGWQTRHRGGGWCVLGARAPSGFSPGHFGKSGVHAGLANGAEGLCGVGREAQPSAGAVSTRVCVCVRLCVCVCECCLPARCKSFLWLR